MLKLLVDNWTLQETADILKYGLNDSRTRFFSAPNFNPSEVPLSAIQIDSLFNTLLDVVLRDKLIVDSRYTPAWIGKNKALDFFEKKGIIEPQEFILGEDFFSFRDSILEGLHLSEELITKHYENIEYWHSYGENKFNAISLVVGGSAGYLTRSNVLDTAYSPHPIRSKFLETTPLFKKTVTAPDIVNSFIEDERHNLIRQVFENQEFLTSRLFMSPIILEIIESSNSTDDLLDTAFQMRDRYSKFRKHLSKFQKAIDDGDIKGTRELKRMLDEISLDLNGDAKFGSTELSLGFGLLKIGKLRLPSAISIRNRFGIRSTIKRMIFKNASKGTIQKFFNFFGERNSKLISEIKKYFQLEM